MNYTNIKKTDPQIYSLIKLEEKRQKEGLELIPSENYASMAVMEAVGSIMTNKYSEGYPNKRYYGGNINVDAIEITAQDRAKELFGVPHANVQPYSGSPANNAVYFALCNPGDTIMGQKLTEGGHLTHGWKVSITGSYFNALQYHVKSNGELDYDEIEKLAEENRPVLIWCGATAYVKQFDYKRLGAIADSCGAYLAADIAHIAGLIIGKVHPDPVPYVHIVTTTTHKTLRGPRGGMIMVTQRGLDKDPELAEKIDRAVFPGSQGGPHDHVTAGIAVALHEAATPEFKTYAKQIVSNAYTLAESLKAHNFTLIGNGTQNHLILIDLRPLDINGWYFEKALEAANITANKNTVPGETNSPFYPSGIRLGTPALTTRGMGEIEMKQVASFIAKVRDIVKTYPYVHEKLTKKDASLREQFGKEVEKDKRLKSLRREIAVFALPFQIPGIA